MKSCAAPGWQRASATGYNSGSICNFFPIDTTKSECALHIDEEWLLLYTYINNSPTRWVIGKQKTHLGKLVFNLLEWLAVD